MCTSTKHAAYTNNQHHHQHTIIKPHMYLQLFALINFWGGTDKLEANAAMAKKEFGVFSIIIIMTPSLTCCP